MFSSPAPQVITDPLPGPTDVKPSVDPSGLQDWLKGAAGAMGSGTKQSKAQSSGFNLGQAVAIGSGMAGGAGRGSSIFSGVGRNMFS